MEDYEYTTVTYGLQVSVDKVGGGTLGRRYTGDWEVTVMNGDEYIYDRDIMYTGMSKSHVGVADMAADMAAELIEERS